MRYLVRCLISFTILLVFTTLVFGETNHHITYQINEESYEGYYVAADKGSPFVLLIHDWDGLTDYEIKRAHMLSELKYSVFAADLFGAGIRPTTIKDKQQRTGELYKDREKMRKLIHGALLFPWKNSPHWQKSLNLPGLSMK